MSMPYTIAYARPAHQDEEHLSNILERFYCGVRTVVGAQILPLNSLAAELEASHAAKYLFIQQRLSESFNLVFHTRKPPLVLTEQSLNHFWI
jgi:hypothetical protein